MNIKLLTEILQFIVKEAFGFTWELNPRSVDTWPFKTCFLEALPDGNSDVPDDNLVALDGRYAGDVHDKGPVHSEKLIDNQFFFLLKKVKATWN